MSFNSTDSVLVQNLSGINTATFKNKKSDDVLSIYKIDNCFNLDENSSPDQIVKELSWNVDCNPDGLLAFVSSEYQDQVKELITKNFLDAFNNDMLNFTNGERCETILYHNVKTGIIMELIDPECGSDFFANLIKDIEKFMTENNGKKSDFLYFDFYHMPCNMELLRETEEGIAILNILDDNNIDYDIDDE